MSEKPEEPSTPSTEWIDPIGDIQRMAEQFRLMQGLDPNQELQLSISRRMYKQARKEGLIDDEGFVGTYDGRRVKAVVV